jgi:hypothetical protein
MAAAGNRLALIHVPSIKSPAQASPLGGRLASDLGATLEGVILDSFRCAAKNLSHPSLKGWSMRLRLDGDSDDASTWHPVRLIDNEGVTVDPTIPFVKGITVEFHDETPDKFFNPDDEVEFAVPRPVIEQS